MLAVRTPGAPRATRSVARPAIPPSPLRDRVGYSDHVRFRGYFPVHFIPAYNLPVYASPWPLPDTTQDSVRGCSLGFTAAAISGDGDQRTCKAQLPHHRAYGSVPRRFGGLSVHQLFHGKQTQTFEARVGEGAVQGVREAHSPRPLWAEDGLAGRWPGYSEAPKFMISPATRLPLDPDDATQAPPNPAVEGLQLVPLAEAKVASPSPQV